MIKCVKYEKTYDAEDTAVVKLVSTEAPTGKTTGVNIDNLPDSIKIADGSYCIDGANDKQYIFIDATWYQINK